MKYLIKVARIAIVLLMTVWLALIFNVQQTTLHLDNIVNTVKS